jgi:DNA-binding NtrC family response regulator
VVKIDLPPLRERPEDVPLLAAHFAQKYTRSGENAKQFSPQAMDSLLKYSWPGNIRELENAIERACVTTTNGAIQIENLPAELTSPAPPKLPFAIDLNRPLPDLLREVCADVEQQYIRKALEQSHGHVGRCAKMCGLSRRTLSARIAGFQINKSVFK